MRVINRGFEGVGLDRSSQGHRDHVRTGTIDRVIDRLRHVLEGEVHDAVGNSQRHELCARRGTDDGLLLRCGARAHDHARGRCAMAVRVGFLQRIERIRIAVLEVVPVCGPHAPLRRVRVPDFVVRPIACVRVADDNALAELHAAAETARAPMPPARGSSQGSTACWPRTTVACRRRSCACAPPCRCARAARADCVFARGPARRPDRRTRALHSARPSSSRSHGHAARQRLSPLSRPLVE